MAKNPTFCKNNLICDRKFFWLEATIYQTNFEIAKRLVKKTRGLVKKNTNIVLA